MIDRRDVLLNHLKKLESEKDVMLRHVARLGIHQQYPDIASSFNELVEESSVYFEEGKQKARVLLRGLFDYIQLMDIKEQLSLK